MKSNLALLSTIGLSCTAVLNVNAQDAPTDEELASYGLTLTEVELIRQSESPNDFAGLASSGSTSQLWTDATIFENQVANRKLNPNATFESLSLHPYLVCNSSPDKSGIERQDEIKSAFSNVPGVNVSDFYVAEAQLQNSDEKMCGVVRTDGNTIGLVYAANPNATEWMEFQPVLPSMKMVKGMVDILQARFGQGEAGDVTSIQDTSSGGLVTKSVLGVQTILCPGVQDFEEDDVPDEEILNAVTDFLVGNGGNSVKDTSFYYNRANNGNGGDSGVDTGSVLHTDRMTFWSDAISTVVHNLTKSDGSNICLDEIIGKNIEFDLNDDVLDVYGKISYEEVVQLGENVGLSNDDVDSCLWFMIMGLATNPLICSLEAQPHVITLCPDGTTDLTKCPEDSGDSLTGSPDTPDSSGAKSAGVGGYWRSITIVSSFAFMLPALF